MTEIECIVERITFQNSENGFSVFKAIIAGKKIFGNNFITVIGTFWGIKKGANLSLKGEWISNPKFGKQFKTYSWVENLPVSIDGIEKYLGSGIIRGIRERSAKKIVDKFGADTIDIIENRPEELVKISGFTEKKVKIIHDGWISNKEIKNIMIFLQGLGISPLLAGKIYKQYGEKSIEVVKNNPYRLANEMWGIGFKTADEIASSLNISKNDHHRCQSGILYVLNQMMERGHVFAYKNDLIETTSVLLEVEKVFLGKILNEMDKKLVVENEAIYLNFMYLAEKYVADRLITISKEKVEQNFLQKLSFEDFLQNSEINYDDIQKEAIQSAILSKIMVLTGGPGTGKTTIIKGIIDLFKKANLDVVLAAPTGRAAKRMTETTGVVAKTIHRLLEYNPELGYSKCEKDKIKGDVLIVDEASMIDLSLMCALLKALPLTMKIIFVGDVDQLPSVGAGNVLRDIIESNILPVIRLKKIFRQALSSRIITNAHKINEGEFPDISNGVNTDFFFIERNDNEKIIEEIKSLIKDRLPKTYNVLPEDIQILTPMQKGDLGTIRLNREVKDALNPSDVFISRGDFVFGLYDKVMQIKNNYDKDIFNGDIGKIIELDVENTLLTVDFDGNIVEYDSSDLDELFPAYAITVHKSQGSEYPIVIIPISMLHYVMLERNLIYTGITRAKKIIVLVGSKKALSVAIKNTRITERNSHLKDRLKGIL